MEALLTDELVMLEFFFIDCFREWQGSFSLIGDCQVVPERCGNLPELFGQEAQVIHLGLEGSLRK